MVKHTQQSARDIGDRFPRLGAIWSLSFSVPSQEILRDMNTIILTCQSIGIRVEIIISININNHNL